LIFIFSFTQLKDIIYDGYQCIVIGQKYFKIADDTFDKAEKHL